MDATPPISALLLARDETRDLEELIPRLAGVAREVVVVWDPRGDHATRDAAERLGARVFERAWSGFGPQRQFALAQCTQDWVLWVDADERLDGAAEAAVRRAVQAGGAFTHHRLGRAGWFLGRRIRWCGWRNERLVRLFRRDAAAFDDAPVHEAVRVRGEGPGDLEGVLEHHSYRTWDDCRTKLVRYAEANADKAWRSGRRAGALDVALRPPLRFARMYVLQLGLLDGAHGLVLCLLASAQVFLKYAALWARTRGARPE
jgi:(heptosyl)LPS beta-1,4-glucosyltransferase